MRLNDRAFVAVIAMWGIVMSGCLGQTETAEDQKQGEHGEESGTELALNETYDGVRNGARLVLSYDKESNFFSGTVENTTKKTLKRVRVEVHLSNGKEIGPTTPSDLKPGEKRPVKLAAKSKGPRACQRRPCFDRQLVAGQMVGAELHGAPCRGQPGRHVLARQAADQVDAQVGEAGRA